MAKYAEFVVNVNNNTNFNFSPSKVTIKRPQNKKITNSVNKSTEGQSLVFTYFNIAESFSKTIVSKIGQYTGNKIAANNANQVIALSSLALAAIINPVQGATALSAYLSNNVSDYAIRIKNSEEESNYKMSLIGNMTSSNSRWRGNFR